MPLTPTATRELLASLGHNPKRFLGQNFLVDGNIVRKSLELAQITSADNVVEIGPGLGTLTSALLETGAHVWAVEKDATLHAHLAATLAQKFPTTFHLIEGDALDYPLAGFEGRARSPSAYPFSDEGRVVLAPTAPDSSAQGRVRETLGNNAKKPRALKGRDNPPGVCGAPSGRNFSRHGFPGSRGLDPGLTHGTPLACKPLPSSPNTYPSAPGTDTDAHGGFGETALPCDAHFKIVANLPYAISTPWMDAVLSGPLPERMVLMLQQEAAQRYTATPGTKQFSAISIFLQSAYDIAPGHKVSAACFYPRPDIESYLLHLVRKPQPFVFAPEMKALVRACFQQRRKQLGALLRGRLPDAAREAWFARLAAAGLSSQARPEEVPVALWAQFQR